MWEIAKILQCSSKSIVVAFIGICPCLVPSQLWGSKQLYPWQIRLSRVNGTKGWKWGHFVPDTLGKLVAIASHFQIPVSWFAGYSCVVKCFKVICSCLEAGLFISTASGLSCFVFVLSPICFALSAPGIWVSSSCLLYSHPTFIFRSGLNMKMHLLLLG